MNRDPNALRPIPPGGIFEVLSVKWYVPAGAPRRPSQPFNPSIQLSFPQNGT